MDNVYLHQFVCEQTIELHFYARIFYMNFNDKYSKISGLVKEEIDKVSKGITKDIGLIVPLKSKLLEILNAPSKHIRPLLSFLYLKAAGINIDEKQISIQTAIELVHNASLIHDDVIDESLIRRNVKTINNEFDNKLAVITGDYLLSKALNILAKLNCAKLITMFSDTLESMTNGEINQQLNKCKIPTLEDYIEKTEQKTAKLFETALCGSLLLANSSKNGSKFARNFGIAFQIRDDIVNIKTTKSDINEGIYTAPVIFAGSVESCENGIEKTRTLLNNYIDKALLEIKTLEDNKYSRALKELLELIANE